MEKTELIFSKGYPFVLSKVLITKEVLPALYQFLAVIFFSLDNLKAYFECYTFKIHTVNNLKV